MSEAADPKEKKTPEGKEKTPPEKITLNTGNAAQVMATLLGKITNQLSVQNQNETVVIEILEEILVELKKKNE